MTQPTQGIPTVDVPEVDRRLAEDVPPPLVVDVREAAELVAARMEAGVAFMPLSEFAQRWAELPRDRPLLLICASGSRSAAATAHLLRNGYTDVANVAGGMIDWERRGLPVRRGPVAPGEGQLPPSG